MKALRDLARLLCCAGLLWLGAAAPLQAQQGSSAPLRIAISKTYSPFAVLTPSGQSAGLFVDLWREWSHATGRPVEFVVGTWSETLEAVRSGRADLHSGLFRNPERDTWLDFSEPIHEIKTAVFVRADRDRPLPIGQLGSVKVGAISNTHQEAFLKQNYVAFQTIGYAGDEALIAALLEGEVRAIVSEVPSVRAALGRLGLGGMLVQVDKPLLTNFVHGAVRKGESALLQEVDAGLRAIPRRRLEALEKRWLPDPADRYYMGGSGRIELTSWEKAWIKKHPLIRFAVTDFIAPVDIVDKNGIYSGFNADLIRLLNSKLAINIVPEFYSQWGDVVAAARAGRVDGAFSLSQTPERQRDLFFSQPYAFDPIILLVREKRSDIGDWKDLLGRRVSVVKQASMLEDVRALVESGEVIEVESEGEALRLLALGKTDAHASWQIPYGNELRRQPVPGLKVVATRISEGSSLRIGIPKNRPALFGIIRKGLNAITQAELAALRERWPSPTCRPRWKASDSNSYRRP